MKQMIDYDATLRVFFEECVKYLNDRLVHAHDAIEYDRIGHAIFAVRGVAANPKKYASYEARVGAKLEPDAEAFMPIGTNDNRVYLIYSSVVNSMGDLYSEYDWYRMAAQQKLLNALKAMKYRNSANVLKDLYFPFVSNTKFAVKAKLEKQK